MKEAADLDMTFGEFVQAYTKVDGQQKQISHLTDMEKKVMICLCAKIVAETED